MLLQDVIDLAETGASVHANMRQVLNENEKCAATNIKLFVTLSRFDSLQHFTNRYVRLEPRLSHPSAASTDAKALRQMAAEAEAWVNENDGKFIVARQRLLVIRVHALALAGVFVRSNKSNRLCRQKDCTSMAAARSRPWLARRRRSKCAAKRD